MDNRQRNNHFFAFPRRNTAPVVRSVPFSIGNAAARGQTGVPASLATKRMGLSAPGSGTGKPYCAGAKTSRRSDLLKPMIPLIFKVPDTTKYSTSRCGTEILSFSHIYGTKVLFTFIFPNSSRLGYIWVWSGWGVLPGPPAPDEIPMTCLRPMKPCGARPAAAWPSRPHSPTSAGLARDGLSGSSTCFPMLIAALHLSRVEVLLLAVLCTVLREALGPFAWNEGRCCEAAWR